MLHLLSHGPVLPYCDTITYIFIFTITISVTILLIMTLLFLSCLIVKSHYPFYTVGKHFHIIYYAYKYISVLTNYIL